MRLDINAVKRGVSQTIAGFRSTPVPCQISYGFLLFGLIIVPLFGSYLIEYLTVVPFRLLPPNFWLWTLATFWFMETNLVLFVCHLICVHISGAVLYPLWNWREWSKYFVLVNTITCIVVVFLSSIIYMLSKRESWYFYSSSDPNNIRGLSAFDGAIFVAIKQALPDTVLIQTPWFGRYKNSHFPFTAVIIGIVVTAFGLLSPVYLMQFVFGSYVGWMYLRFYQKHPNPGSPNGDPSDSFTFASFFPSILQPPISIFSDAVYRVALRLKIIKPVVRRFVDMGGIGGSLQSVVVGGQSATGGAKHADAERKRQKALRDLNERLAKAKEQSSTQLAWPSLVDDEDDQDQRKQQQPMTHGSPIDQIPSSTSSAAPSSASADIHSPVTSQSKEDEL